MFFAHRPEKLGGTKDDIENAVSGEQDVRSGERELGRGSRTSASASEVQTSHKNASGPRPAKGCKGGEGREAGQRHHPSGGFGDARATYCNARRTVQSRDQRGVHRRPGGGVFADRVTLKVNDVSPLSRECAIALEQASPMPIIAAFCLTQIRPKYSLGPPLVGIGQLPDSNRD
jgi:hypothetical protein